MLKIPANKEDVYPNNRQISFNEICSKLKSDCAITGENFALFKGDCEKLLKKIPSHSVDLILTDPPYHTTKKANIYGDTNFEGDEEFLLWIDVLTKEWLRILKPNGSIYLYCSSDMAPFIYVRMATKFNMHSIITWTKPNEPGYDGWKQKMKKSSLRRWYPHTERIVFASPALEGNLKRSPFATFLKDCRKLSGLTANKLTELIGAYGKINNGGAVSNWETGRNIPSREQYQKICDAFINTNEISIMPAYEDVVRAFIVNEENPITDTWDFMNVRQYKGKHPAEKPEDMLRHIIQTSSYEDDIVLDCFAGSGSTLISALKEKRRTIGIEIEPKWIDYASKNIARKFDGETVFNQAIKDEHVALTIEELPLFGTTS